MELQTPKICVLKFGGTSVQDAESIKAVGEIIINHQATTKLVVVSAFAGVTNKLYQAWNAKLERDFNKFSSIINSIFEQAKTICKGLGLENIPSGLSELNKSIFDSEENTVNSSKIYGMGEEISSIIIAEYLKDHSIKLLNSRDYIYTKGGSKDFELEASYTYKKLGELKNNVNSGGIFLLPGFVATDSYGRDSILGRGGSDFTAAIIAAGVDADRLEIWTDVSGMLSADPKRISSPLPIKHLTFKEASELAYFGAKVLHPKTILPVINKDIPVFIKNTKKPSDYGTLITGDSQKSYNSVKAISSRGDITIVNIVSNRMLGAYGFMKKVFEVFDKYKTPVDLVATTEVSVSVTIDDLEFIELIKDELSRFSTISIDKNNASISIVGEGLGLTAGVAAEAFSALKGINVKMVSFGANEVNLSIVVDGNKRDEAVIELHRNLIEKKLN